MFLKLKRKSLIDLTLSNGSSIKIKGPKIFRFNFDTIVQSTNGDQNSTGYTALLQKSTLLFPRTIVAAVRSNKGKEKTGP